MPRSSTPAMPLPPAPAHPSGWRLGVGLIASVGAHAALLLIGMPRCTPASGVAPLPRMQLVAVAPTPELSARLDAAREAADRGRGTGRDAGGDAEGEPDDAGDAAGAPRDDLDPRPPPDTIPPGAPPRDGATEAAPTAAPSAAPDDADASAAVDPDTRALVPALPDAAPPAPPTPEDAPSAPLDAEPAPEPEPEPELPEWTEYVQADADARAARPDEPTPFISSRDADADERTRTHVTATAQGRRAEIAEGTPVRTGTPAMMQVEGQETGELGDRPLGGTPRPTRPEAKAGGGRRGERTGLGAPDRGGDLPGGPLARSGRAAAPAPAEAGGGASGAEGPPPAPLGTEPPPAAGWWKPAAARIVVPPSAPAAAAVVAPLPTEADARAPVLRPDRKTRRGGTERPDPIDEEAPEQERDQLLPDPGDPTDSPEAEAPVETFLDLRAELGWGGVADTRAPPRRTTPGVESEDGHLPTSPQITAADLAIAEVVFVEAVDTPLGRYRGVLDEEIRANWLASDLSVHDRALGLQGDTTLEFRVVAGGRVEAKRIVRSSGIPALDALALDAVPERLPRIPKELGMTVLYHRYTFRYRNPLIVDPPAPRAP
jgi:TonB family protein